MESPGQWISMEKKIKDWALRVSNIKGLKRKGGTSKGEWEEGTSETGWKKTEKKRAGGPRAAVPSLWDLILDDLRWNWWE